MSDRLTEEQYARLRELNMQVSGSIATPNQLIRMMRTGMSFDQALQTRLQARYTRSMVVAESASRGPSIRRAAEVDADTAAFALFTLRPPGGNGAGAGTPSDNGAGAGKPSVQGRANTGGATASQPSSLAAHSAGGLGVLVLVLVIWALAWGLRR